MPRKRDFYEYSRASGRNFKNKKRERHLHFGALLPSEGNLRNCGFHGRFIRAFC